MQIQLRNQVSDLLRPFGKQRSTRLSKRSSRSRTRGRRTVIVPLLRVSRLASCHSRCDIPTLGPLCLDAHSCLVPAARSPPPLVAWTQDWTFSRTQSSSSWKQTLDSTVPSMFFSFMRCVLLPLSAFRPWEVNPEGYSPPLLFTHLLMVAQVGSEEANAGATGDLETCPTRFSGLKGNTKLKIGGTRFSSSRGRLVRDHNGSPDRARPRFGLTPGIGKWSYHQKVCK